MPRPATPLSVLLLIAFGLLLVAVLSAPIIGAIPLGSFNGVNYGVFGYCKSDDGCTSFDIGYDTTTVFEDDSDETEFDIPSAARNTLTLILIIHPVAALIVLIYFFMAIAAHAHSAAHSSRYLLCLFLFGLFGFLVCLFAFLVDVLLFMPHLAWGSYLVLAAAIIVAISGLVSCMMRRSMVSRKVRRNKVQDNSDMNGQTYMPRKPALPPTDNETMTQQPTVPVLSGAGTGHSDIPYFSPYEAKKKDDESSDERIPLTARSPSDKSPNKAPCEIINSYDASGNYGPPSRSNTGVSPPVVQPRDQYGNSISPREVYGTRRGSTEKMNYRGGGISPPAYRGRGGYGPPARAGYGLNGSMPSSGRGGYGPRGRGGYGPRGGPHGGLRGGGGYGQRGGGGYGQGGMRGGRTAPQPSGPYQAGYNTSRDPSPGITYADLYQENGRSTGSTYQQSYFGRSTKTLPRTYQAYSPNDIDYPRAESPPPLPSNTQLAPCQATEMDATPSPVTKTETVGSQAEPIRDGDTDVAGMVALQQGHTLRQQQDQTSPAGLPSEQGILQDESQNCKDDQYVSARNNWDRSPATGGDAPGVSHTTSQDLPVAAAELPAHPSPPRSQENQPLPATALTQAENNYYEDVDPRFAETNQEKTSIALTYPSMATQPLAIISSSTPYDEIPAGARSPAESERSTFTSISQRGVNPRWNGGPPHPTLGPHQIPRRPIPQRAPPGPDILSSNPDFQLSTAGGRRGPGTIPNSAYPPGL